MRYPESPDPPGIEGVILRCLRQALAVLEGPYLSWATDAIPPLLSDAWGELPPEESRRLSFLLARAVWEATPRPDRGFGTRVMDGPDPGGDCPCGSASAYSACCGQVTDAPTIPEELIWELLLGELDESRVLQALDSGRLPAQLGGLAAQRLLDANRPGRAAALLEPFFEPDADPLPDQRLEHALNILCDAYDQRNHWRKKARFLERMTAHPCRALRAAAWQRLCTIEIDEGDFTAAQLAFAQAQRESPDNPGTALLEITLLAAQNEDELARERALFWRHKLRRDGAADEDMIAFLAHAFRDPQEALMSSQSEIIDPRLMALREWVGSAAARPLPTYALKPLRGRAPPDRQLSLFDGLDAAALPVPKPLSIDMARICPPAAVRQLDSRWKGLVSCPKPLSTHLIPTPPWDLWGRDDWIPFLTSHPEAADSLDILDDLATALYIHPESALTWISRSLLTPLLERAGRIIDRVLPPHSSGTTPWSSAENRSALRLLFRLYLARMEEGRESAAMDTLHALLRLNPSDNHGARAELMNHYLRRREDHKALDLAERFPDDLLAELAYGEVLALYRLGARSQARHALGRALARLPRIPRYLTRKRVPQLRETVLEGPLRPEDEALLYREAMLDVWEAEPGLLDWLKKNAK